MAQRVGLAVRYSNRRLGLCRKPALLALLAAFMGIANAAEPQPEARNQDAPQQPDLAAAKPQIWAGEVGAGFEPSAESFSLGLGAGHGLAILGGHEAHNLALMSLEYGHMLWRVQGEGHWYRGNFEFRAELFSGAEFSPSEEWVVGLAPHLRYNFATGTRWVPFLDLGAGVTATSIGPPDLSNVFEFNLQACIGVHRFLRDNLALTVEARYMHMSCAGLSSPNAGLNSVLGFLGLSWYF